MHSADPSGSEAAHRHTLPQTADSCCAASEAHHPAPTMPMVVPVAAPALIVTLVPLEHPAVRVRPRASRAPAPVPGAGIARHLFLATLLV